VADEVYGAYTNLLVQADETCQFGYKTYVVRMFIYCIESLVFRMRAMDAC